MLLLLRKCLRVLLLMHLTTHELHVHPTRIHWLLLHHLRQKWLLWLLLRRRVMRRWLLLLLLLVLHATVVKCVNAGVGSAVHATVCGVEALGLRYVVALKDWDTLIEVVLADSYVVAWVEARGSECPTLGLTIATILSIIGSHSLTLVLGAASLALTSRSTVAGSLDETGTVCLVQVVRPAVRRLLLLVNWR